MRKYISIIIGVLIILLGLLVFKVLSVSKQEPVNTPNNTPISVKATRVKLQDIPYRVEVTGTITAKEKVGIYSEVQGIMKYTNIPFKTGNSFASGQTLIAIASEEYYAQVLSTRSDFMNQLASMLPDMEIDFPKAYKKWETYLLDFEVNVTTPKLPDVSSNKEKLFVSGKNIYNAFYNIKNMEEHLSKFTIKAPFQGTIIESNVTRGTLIRSGQKLGEIIDNTGFELQVSLPASKYLYVQKGSEVEITTLDGAQGFKGVINRMNAIVNQETQTIDAVVEINDSRLKDGVYLKALIYGSDMTNVCKISNYLILENNKVYVIQENELQLVSIEVLNYENDMVIVTGLPKETVLVNQTIANAYPGMKVKIANDL